MIHYFLPTSIFFPRRGRRAIIRVLQGDVLLPDIEVANEMLSFMFGKGDGGGLIRTIGRETSFFFLLLGNFSRTIFHCLPITLRPVRNQSLLHRPSSTQRTCQIKGHGPRIIFLQSFCLVWWKSRCQEVDG